MRQQRRGHLHEVNASEERRRNKPRQVPHHAASQGDQERFALQPLFGELVVTGLDGSKILGSLTRRNLDERRFKTGRRQRRKSSFSIFTPDGAIGNHGTQAAEFQPLTLRAEIREQPFSNLDGIASLFQ